YCFGQMQDKGAIKILKAVLEDENQEPMVRHEAAEALGAIGSDEALESLQKYKDDKVIEVAETCELALERINWLKESHNEIKNLSESIYNSVDPAPPAQSKDVSELKKTLLDDEATLFNRYRAMFALRNIGSDDAITALGEALNHGSALFKHEIAFVLGQMQKESSVSFLRHSLEDNSEN
nr:nero [Cucujiformia]